MIDVGLISLIVSLVMVVIVQHLVIRRAQKNLSIVLKDHDEMETTAVETLNKATKTIKFWKSYSEGLLKDIGDSMLVLNTKQFLIARMKAREKTLDKIIEGSKDENRD